MTRLRLSALVVVATLGATLVGASTSLADPLPAHGLRSPEPSSLSGTPADGQDAGSAAPISAPAGCDTTFTDVACSHPFYEEIEWLAREEVLQGFSDGTFRPRRDAPRQAVAAFFHRIAGAPDPPEGGWPDPGFWDVPASHPFYDEIAWFAAEGYTEGFSDGGFHPSADVTRQAFSAFAYRYAGSEPGPFEDPGFSDVPSSHPFATEIRWMARYGITSGYPDGGFHPSASITRQGIAAFLYRLVNLRLPCDDLDPRQCFLPFPSDYFMRPSVLTDTGLAFDVDPSVMPANDDGDPMDPTLWLRNDGASPGTNLLAYVPGLDLDESGVTRITDMSTYDATDAPIVVIDTVTGERHPVWAELDARATSDANRLLIVRATRNYVEGRRYVVGLRNLKDSTGTLIPAGTGFTTFRDSIPTTSSGVEARRPHMEEIFDVLGTAGVDRSELYLAWDFTVASERNLSERLLHMRDESFALLGPDAPGFTVTSTTYDSSNGTTEVVGTFEVPKYFTGAGAAARMTFGPDGLPEPSGTYDANFVCMVPDSATTSDPALMSLFQHGLFGNALDTIRSAEDYVNPYNAVFCGTDWIAMSTPDLLNLLPIVDDLSNFPSIADRGQQGILDTLVLARLMGHPEGLASHPAFSDGGVPTIDLSEVVYAGGSQGGIMGGAATAVSTEWTKSVLAVPGQNYSVMLTRSVHWETFIEPYINYSDEVDLTVGLSFMQMLWDRAESNGYSQHLTTDTYPGTPAHRVLLFEAFGDHQVANVTTEALARTAGIPLRTPALGGGRSNLAVPFWGLDPVPAFPWADSALVVWDWGTPAPPLDNTAPSSGSDPHSLVVEAPLAMGMIATFLTDGVVTDVCGAAPCTTP